MAAQLRIEWYDGFITVSPFVPESLTKRLKYWHRTVEKQGFKLVTSGHYRALYTIKNDLNHDGSICQTLSTMPGFLYRVKNLLLTEGYTVELIDRRAPMPSPCYEKAFEGLRDYQLECAYVAIASGGGMISCPTGWGKTHIMAAIIKAFDPEELKIRGTPIVVVATPEQDITRKDYNDLVELLPDRKVGLVMGGVKRFSDDVQVVTLDSIQHIPPNDIGILIVDEVHTASSDKRTDMLMAAARAAKWGVSATPDGRYDGRDLVTEGLFGPVVYRRTYEQGVTDGALVPISVCWLEVPEPDIGMEKYLKYKTRNGKYRNGLDRNDSHNQLVSDVLMKVDPQQYQTLCIMPHIDQMGEIVRRCPDVKYVHAQTNTDALLADGITNIKGISAAERRDTYQSMASGDLRKVISTHVYKQGVNFPQLGIILNAGGGGGEIAAKQIPGRESRKIDESYGKERSYLVDFRHSWDMETNKHGKKVPGPILKDDISRGRYYTSLGFEQTWYKSVDELPFIARSGDGRD